MLTLWLLFEIIYRISHQAKAWNMLKGCIEQWNELEDHSIDHRQSLLPWWNYNLLIDGGVWDRVFISNNEILYCNYLSIKKMFFHSHGEMLTSLLFWMKINIMHQIWMQNKLHLSLVRHCIECYYIRHRPFSHFQRYFTI